MGINSLAFSSSWAEWVPAVRMSPPEDSLRADSWKPDGVLGNGKYGGDMGEAPTASLTCRF